MAANDNSVDSPTPAQMAEQLELLRQSLLRAGRVEAGDQTSQTVQMQVGPVHRQYLEGMQAGLGLGLLIGLVVLVLLWLLQWHIRRRRRHASIVIPGERGDLTLSRRAVKDLATAAIQEYRDVTCRNVTVRAARRGHAIEVDLEVAPGTPLRTQRKEMEAAIESQLRDLAGVTEELEVHTNVLSYAGDRRTTS